MSDITIYCPRTIRALWPSRLPREWARVYPQLFDRQDVELTRNQPRNHFAESFAAIHIFQRDGLWSLVEKYAFRSHTTKRRLLERVLGSSLTIFEGILEDVGGQPPDLLLYSGRYQLVGFAEVKGPRDRLKPRQLRMHHAIRKHLRAAVEIVNVRLV
jgi:hypothetical protein